MRLVGEASRRESFRKSVQCEGASVEQQSRVSSTGPDVSGEGGGAPSAEDDLPQLVDRCLAGDDEAVRAFVRRYERLLLSMALRMLGDRQEAEDVVQDSFVRIVRSLDRWDRSRAIVPWLTTITMNRCRTALGRRQRRAVPADLPEQAVEMNAAERLERSDDAATVAEAIGQLPPNWREAVTLHYGSELSCGEVAEALGCAEGTVKTWLFRARAKLRETLRQTDAGVVLVDDSS